MNRESLGIGVAVNWGRLDFVTLTYSSRRKPKKKKGPHGVAWVLFPQKKNTAKRNHHAGLFSFEEEESRWSSRRFGVMNCFPRVFLAIVCVRDPHVFFEAKAKKKKARTVMNCFPCFWR